MNNDETTLGQVTSYLDDPVSDLHLAPLRKYDMRSISSALGNRQMHHSRCKHW